MKNLFLTLSILLNSILGLSQPLTINISENHFKIDEANSLIVSHIENIETYNNISGFSEVIMSLNQNDYSFNSIPTALEYSNSYLVTGTSTANQYTLYFTQLPIISIESSSTILDEPKTLANFVYADNEQILISKIGIELRGGFSQSFPKKTYDLEFWEDDNGEDTHNVQFGNLRSDDDWILDALYNEPLRLRSYVANKLWLDLHTPNYLEDESKAKSGADVKYVELFLNGGYNGIYNLSEQVDKKQLKLKSFKDEIRGELYKGVSWGGAVNFTRLPTYDNSSRIWGGYEMKYPKDDDITDWDNLYQFTDFVMNSSNTQFIDNIWEEFDFDNYSDYFLFLNLLRATDNTGKNVYLAKYQSDEPYFYVPWDLDGCFGTIWNGNNENITNDILINGLIDRVIVLNPNNSATAISNKWFEYRNNVFDSTSLIEAIETQYEFLLNNKIYEREALVHSNYPFSEQDLLYMLNWLENRLNYLDTYFGNILSVNENNSKENKVSIFPNPIKDKIYIANINYLADKEYKLFNFSGKLINQGNIKENFIPIKNLEKGYYFMVLDNETYKLLVK
ncbi:CotH kinase family protein [Flavivirga algicola]|uniref:T9SS type A sorting domain-containing protein n=1 Tax=Flavivirga algicola TaxID=2729136 RepID=A0ABX1RRU4_9FLAO|nr:CotH kinase family protein [Flavivirga algicola]NMH86276.1 T9SS type A sorting domain-containing protein [Flavivirga algicola]